MLWAALLLPRTSANTPPPDDQLDGLATWALLFTPRVATVDEAVVMEVEASARLFGGKRALRDRIVRATLPEGAHVSESREWEKRLRGELPSLLDKTRGVAG